MLNLRPSRALGSALLAIAAALAGTAAAQAAQQPLAQLARSAQVIIEGARSGNTLTLRIRRTGDQTLVGSKDITVSVDGRGQRITPQPDGSYAVSLDNSQSKDEPPLQIVVGHDGIREVLDGKLPRAGSISATNLLGDHKQLAWWILNVAVVLVGAWALSRRKPF